MSTVPSIVNVHTPSSSFAIVHSLTQSTLTSLFDTLSRKLHTPYAGRRVGPGWLKYEWSETIWSLDDDADYTIFVWRQQQRADKTPTLHLQDPSEPLPIPPAYQNPSFFVFLPSRVHEAGPTTSSPRPHSQKSRKVTGSGGVKKPDNVVLKLKKEFENFHSTNGVRTVMGSFGPVKRVRMLLKEGHRHVYVSRKFALNHKIIPGDSGLGRNGYSGIVNIGSWPITLSPAGEQPNTSTKPKTVFVQVYLSEEPHFDVVLGRSFFERRQIRTNPIDPTDVVCLDTGEKVDCELVILKDGRGEFVTVT